MVAHSRSLLALLLLSGCLPTWPGMEGEAAGDGAGLSDEELDATEFFARFGTDGIEVERRGLPPVVLSRTPERTESACGFRMHVPAFGEIGDKATVTAGLGRASPLVLSQDGLPLQRRQDEDLASACLGLYAQPARYMLFSPRDITSPEALGDRRFEVSFSEALPLDAPGGGPVWWVYPGTQVRLSVPDDLGDLDVIVSARLALFGEGGAPRLWLDRDSEALVGGTSTVTLEGVVAGGGWNVGVSSPEDGPFVVIERLSVSHQGVSRTLVGPPELEGLVDLRSLAQTVPRGERVELLAEAEVVPTGEPLPGGPLAFEAGRDGWAKGPLEDWLFLSEDHLEDLGLPREAGPLRVLEDGVALAANENCRRVRTELRGASCMAKGLVFASSTDGQTPGEGGHAYAWTLDPERSLPGGTWLYEGDRIELTVPAGLLVDATHLAVWATKVTAREAILSLAQGDQEILTLDLVSSAEGPAAFALPEGFDPYGPELSLVVDGVDGLLALRQLFAVEGEG